MACSKAVGMKEPEHNAGRHPKASSRASDTRQKTERAQSFMTMRNDLSGMDARLADVVEQRHNVVAVELLEGLAQENRTATSRWPWTGGTPSLLPGTGLAAVG